MNPKDPRPAYLTDLNKMLETFKAISAAQIREVDSLEKRLAEKDAQLAEARAALEAIAHEANRNIKNIGGSARRGDQGMSENWRYIRTSAEQALAKLKPLAGKEDK